MTISFTSEEQAIINQAVAILESKITTGDAIGGPLDAATYLRLRFGALEHEVFVALWMDNKNRVIADEVLFRGTIDSAAVYPREVIKAALANNAAAVIFGHNHPSGVAEPSRADITLTRRLREALDLVEVRLLDHIVVGREGWESMNDRGQL